MNTIPEWGYLKHDGEFIKGSGSPAKWPLSQYGGQAVIRVGKKAAGRLLDGREWNEFPTKEAA
jgi:protein gp37